MYHNQNRPLVANLWQHTRPHGTYGFHWLQGCITGCPQAWNTFPAFLLYDFLRQFWDWYLAPLFTLARNAEFEILVGYSSYITSWINISTRQFVLNPNPNDIIVRMRFEVPILKGQHDQTYLTLPILSKQLPASAFFENIRVCLRFERHWCRKWQSRL